MLVHGQINYYAGSSSNHIPLCLTPGTTAPSVIGLTRFNASVNTLFSAVYSVNYTGNYSVTIEAINKPTDATFVYDDGSDSYVFEWTPADLQSHSIQ